MQGSIGFAVALANSGFGSPAPDPGGGSGDHQATHHPIYITEAGWNAGEGRTNTLSRTAQAKYAGMLLAGNFGRGIARTYLFSAYQDNGMGITGHPAGNVVRELTALCADSMWDARTQTRNTPRFEPGILFYSLTATKPAGAAYDNNLRHLLLQKKDGDYYLLLWNEVPVYVGSDSKGTLPHGDLPNPPVPVTLTFGTSLRAATVYTQKADGSYAASYPALAGQAGAQRLQIAVPDCVQVVRLSPGVPDK